MARYKHVYQKAEWEKIRKVVIVKANGLCERCSKKGVVKPGKIVHHKQWLNDKNNKDWNVAYNAENLEYICNDCHEEEHGRTAGLINFIEPVTCPICKKPIELCDRN